MTTPSGQGFLAESAALQSAASSRMPRQASAWDGLKSLLSGHQVPGDAVGTVSRSQAAANGHRTKVQNSVHSLGGAMKRLDDRIGGDGISNHASATAIDLDATLHVQGVRDTCTPAQVTEIHNIVNETGGGVRWGGDYPPPTKIDDMHFEIAGTPDQVAGYATQLRAAQQQQGQ